MKFYTSTDDVHGMVLESPDDLITLKTYPSYFDGKDLVINVACFGIDPDQQWYEGMFVPDIRGMATLESKQYKFHSLRLHDGWIKMELDDPFYGEPEWEALPMVRRKDIAEAALMSASVKIVSDMVVSPVLEKFVNEIREEE